jgi:hypothetical protein
MSMPLIGLGVGALCLIIAKNILEELRIRRRRKNESANS